MKVLWVNSRYFVSGGPETYMFAAGEMLEAAGHEVVPFSARYDRNRQTPWSEYFVSPIAGDDEVYFREHTRSIRTLTRGLKRAFYAPDVHASLSALIRVVDPDVAVVQQYLRKLSPSVLVALREAHVPIVVRLSDFAMVCPAATLLRDGRVCHRCLTNGLAWSVRYRCVQHSFGASAVVCASMWFAKWRKYFDLIDYYLAPSAVMRDQMIAGGYDASRIAVLPTFVDSARIHIDGARARRIVYVGRLSPEKGLDVLLDAFELVVRQDGSRDIELLLAGGGEDCYVAGLAARARRISPQVKFVGMLDAGDVRRLLCSALISVVPSLWYENLPNAMLESLAAGTPVAASDLGSMTDVLRGTDAGFLFRPGDPGDLAESLVALLREPDTLKRMSRSARHLAETRYSPDAHLRGLLRVLNAAVERGDRIGD